jgi:hypothetical protein
MSVVFIPIKFGYIEQGTFIGWTVISCRFCRTAQPAFSYDITHQNTLYGMKVSNAQSYSKRLVCSFCNEEHDLFPNAPIKINQQWNFQQGFQNLVDTTKPELGFIGDRVKRSDSEVKAILRRVEDWTRYSFHNEGNIGCLFGFLALFALIIGGIIGYNIPPTESVGSFVIVFGVPFAIICCLISYFIIKHFTVRRMLLKRLSNAGNEKGISREDFVKSLKTMPNRKKELVWAVNKL